jgi:hypothetical protein
MENCLIMSHWHVIAEKITFNNCQTTIQNYKPAWCTWITLTGIIGWVVKKKHLLLASNKTIGTRWVSK